MTDFDYTQPRLTAGILCLVPERADELQRLALQCGCQIRPLGESVDFLLIDFCSDSDAASADWAEIHRYLYGNATEALVWAPLEGVDAAFAEMPPNRCHFFVDAADWQAAPILSGAMRAVKAKHLTDSTRDGGQSELSALHRISSELADFARTLANIAENDKHPSSTVNDKPSNFRHAPADALKPIAQPSGRNTPFNTRHIREIIKLRRMRERLLGEDLFADPGWDILLDLFAAQEEGQQVSVSSLCIAAAVPPTTALRWITNMTEAGYLIRRQDPYDARRVYIELSENMTGKLKDYFETIADRVAVPI
ncbi:hypothetical protein [uncultured Sphingorhabdus sp.]|uniref:hypothetical protein n=1 Tax=uncultured Sphingorhabdus sp. TaxID=1686106 RepID=UPI0026221BF4|nr:hypothetical protein [uncultured Sphingorhabdus sp.]HMS19419.1 hypothetical protein [Sphingorhabdus sp.]